MKKIIAIIMAMLLVTSVTVALAGGAKDVNPEADAGLIEFTQEKGSQDIESAYDGEQIRIECKFMKPIVERGEYDRVKVKNLRNIGNSGEPVLPFKTLNILLPQGKTVQSIEVTGNQIHLPGEYRVEPAQEPVPVGSESKYRTLPDPAIYESTNPFPGKMFIKASIQELRGYNILILNLYPVQYIPKAGKISYFENMNVIVNTAPDAISGNFRGLPQDRTRVLDVVDNPEIIETYSAQPTSIADPADSYAYVIITGTDLESAFQPLADWKYTKGVKTTIVTVENITADPDYDGVDTQDKIRNFIIDAYNNWSITYVLLGGDVEVIPTRDFRAPVQGGSIPSDLYYAGLNGTWDTDGDRRYGEPGEEDLYAEVYVGRAPVNTVEDVLTFVAKTIAYEKNPPADYLKNALMLASMLNADTDGADTKNTHICPKIPEDWTIAKIYESDDIQRGNLVALTTAALNSGQHIVNNICHANENLLALGYVLSDPDELYTIPQVDGLLNAQKYFLFYTIGCYANAFDYDDCIGEHFVDNKNGAFAFIGNTRYGWYIPGYPGEGPSDKFDIEFFDALFVEDITNIGKTLQHSKEDLAGSAFVDPYMRYCYYELALLGDPETSLATVPTEPPVLTTIEVSSETLTLYEGETQQFDATAYDQYGNEMTGITYAWTSSNTTVGTINDTGFFTAIDVGTTTIEATNGTVKGNTTVTVMAAPVLTTIGVSPETWTLYEGATQQFDATAYDQYGTEMTGITYAWTSSNETVGTIDGTTGLFTAKDVGTTTIEATNGTISGEAHVTVEAAPVQPTTVSVHSIIYGTEGGWGGDRHLLITVALLDDLDNDVADASVSIDVYLGVPLYDPYTGTTGTDGTVTFRETNAPPGIYSTTVTNVTVEGLTWDEVIPVNEFEKS